MHQRNQMRMLPQQYCLRWRYHHSNLQTMFSQLLEREAFCDVTLACEGRTIRAHKIVLSACSTFFDNILSQYEEKDPIVIMKDVKFIDIKCLVEFMYKGEINVDHCHLATLLKTAEELKIKGLAEVCWKDEDDNSIHTTNGTPLQSVSAVMDTSPTAVRPESREQNKRKRGRPPLDDCDYGQDVHLKIASVEEYSNDAASLESHQQWERDEDAYEDSSNVEESPPLLKVKPEFKLKMEFYHEESDGEQAADRGEIIPGKQYVTKPSSSTSTGSNQQSSSVLPATVEKEWPDVIKMNDYLNTGRRQQFWEEPFTKRVMDAIKHKNLEMKIAAELLGVSYGTLYGRYRDAYGCLKHPYRMKEFWSEQGPTDIITKLKRKEITLFRAAEQLNITPQTLSHYLISMAAVDKDSAETASATHGGSAAAYEEIEWDEDADVITPDVLYQQITSAASGISALASTSMTTTSLLNCPDITIIKKDKEASSSIAMSRCMKEPPASQQHKRLSHIV